MRIIGIDPGTAILGYGIIEVVDGELHPLTYGVITTPAKQYMPERLQQIYRELNELIGEYRPDSAAVEELFFGRNVTTAITVGQARGVVLLALANAHIPIAEYSPLKVKDTITGYGKADKAQMQMMVQNLLNLEEIPRPDDAADGLAIAIAHYYHSRQNYLMQE